MVGQLLLNQGRDLEAAAQFQEGLRLDPDNFQAMAALACVLAADEDPRVRDGRAALNLALKADNLSGATYPEVLDVLAMAWAETGRFTEAQQAEQQAIEAASDAGFTNTIAAFQQRLRLFENHQPYRRNFTNTVPREAASAP
jgi:cytochrome c-type biogenesis protein CcmH/NrfG